MFSESAWEILLTLYSTEDNGPRWTVTGLAQGTGTAPTTALRWFDYLEQSGLIVRVASPTDRRMVFVNLAELGRAKMDAYLQNIDSYPR